MAIFFGLANSPRTNKLSKPPSLERSQGTENEFGSTLLGAPRQTERLIKIVSEYAAKPASSLPQWF